MSIEATDQAPPGAAPETAAVRLIFFLPPPWTAVLTGVTRTTATLTLAAAGEPATGEPAAGTALDAVDAALSRPELRGWIRG
ncbi:hypothetical protein GXW82_10170 [Streptacidiphilus sp. 4-A2]|nr:hypothetical protein [Streptacidiphilus sp. 4-A2]